jgi:hypothetical protein
MTCNLREMDALMACNLRDELQPLVTNTFGIALKVTGMCRANVGANVAQATARVQQYMWTKFAKTQTGLKRKKNLESEKNWNTSTTTSACTLIYRFYL